MKLLHTSDLLLGQAFPRLPELASFLRETRMEAVRSLLALAQREKVDAIVLAGNTLADSRVAHDTVVKLTSLLTTSTIPIYLRPGQTDPSSADSPYVLRSDLFQAPLHVLKEPRLPWDGPLVAVGEGLAGAQYVAMAGSPLPRQNAPAYWSGTPEGYDYGQGQGSVNLVSFPGPEVRSLPLGRLNWLERDADSLTGLTAQLTPLASENTLLRLKLTGTASLEDYEKFEAWRSTLRFQWLEVDNQMRIVGGKRFHHPLLRALQEKLEDTALDPASARRAVLKLQAVVAQSGKEDLV